MVAIPVSCGMFQKCLTEPLGVIVCGLRTCAVAVVMQVIRYYSHLPDDGCDEYVGLVVFCADEVLCEVVEVISNW